MTKAIDRFFVGAWFFPAEEYRDFFGIELDGGLPGVVGFASLGDEGEENVGVVGAELLQDFPKDFAEEDFGTIGFGVCGDDFVFEEGGGKNTIPAVDDRVGGVGFGEERVSLPFFFTSGEVSGGSEKFSGVAFAEGLVGFATAIEFLEGDFPV